MESLNINVNGAIGEPFLNGNYSGEMEIGGSFPNGDQHTVDTSDADPTPTYNDAFPPLSTIGGSSVSKQPVWGQGNSNKVKQAGAPAKPKILSSNSTQVSVIMCNVPCV